MSNDIRFLKFLDNMNLGGNISMDLTKKTIDRVSFSINQVIFKTINLNYQMDRTFGMSPVTNMSLGLRLDLSILRSTTDIKTYGMKEVSFDQEFQGIIGYNSDLKELLVTNSTISSNIGSGAANIRTFLDANGNEKYDEGEQLIPDVKIRVPNASVNNRSQGDMVQVYNLNPYTRYNVELDVSSIKNPLWIPMLTQFSFIADPNVYKRIDIPCYSGGVVEGNVEKFENGEKKGQQGVKVHVLKSDSSYYEKLPVFSDGSFYKMGVPPGDYTSWVDSAQLAILDLKPIKPILKFTIAKTTLGDFVSGINFELVSKDTTIKIKKELEKPKNQPIPKSIDTTSFVKFSKSKKKEDKLASLKSGVSIEIVKNEFISDTIQYPKITDPITPGNLRPLWFAKSRVTFLGPGMKRFLDRLAEYLKANPKATLKIDGHSDNFGTMDENIQVSKTRANEVYGYLVTKGISKYRLFVAGHGSLKPIADPETPAGRAKNMRVELLLENN
jgi:outer membrane protein OmpA-like peptidoglycan-associated protein